MQKKGFFLETKSNQITLQLKELMDPELDELVRRESDRRELVESDNDINYELFQANEETAYNSVSFCFQIHTLPSIIVQCLQFVGPNR